jgi:hypothetical protein
MDNKRFQAIVNAVFKNNFEGDKTINPSFLKQELFAVDSVTVQGRLPKFVS